jgi:hypothetical protein
VCAKWFDRRNNPSEDPPPELPPGATDPTELSEERFQELQTKAQALADDPRITLVMEVMLNARRTYALSYGVLQNAIAAAQAPEGVELLMVNAIKRQSMEPTTPDEVSINLLRFVGPWLANFVMAAGRARTQQSED